MDPFGVPLVNTFILLASGATLTRAHEGLIQGDKLIVVS
jgi:heme/copper-type cytochrome/quinol oxidase subunit 3